MKKQRETTEIQMCLDEQCVVAQKIIIKADDLKQHISHNPRKGLEEILQDLQENEGAVNQFMFQDDLNDQLKFIDDEKEILKENFILLLNLRIETVKEYQYLIYFRGIRKKYVETLRLKDILRSIKTKNLDVLQQTKGDFSFLLNIKNLNNFSFQLKDRNPVTCSGILATINKSLEEHYQYLEIREFEVGTQIEIKQDQILQQFVQQWLENKNDKVISEQMTPNQEEKCTEIKDSVQNVELHYDNGDFYKGQWQNGQRNGEGELIYTNGDLYRGSFKQDTRHGHGKFLWNNGIHYEGEWFNDMQHGSGEESFENGDKFVGNQKADERNGYGEYHYANGTVYSGEWLNDKENGQGIEIYENGDNYVGCFKAGKKDGYGEYYSADGNIYKGQWLNDCKNGKGKYIWADGAQFKGSFKADKRDGYGKQTHSNGIVHKGQWQDNKRK